MKATGEQDVELITVNGRTYRRVVTGESLPSPIARVAVAAKRTALKGPSSSNACCFDSPDSACDDDAIGVTAIRGSDGVTTFTAAMEIPPVCHGFIIGKGGATKSRIESETRATIALPPRGSGSASVTITGPTESAVVAARTRIDVLLVSVEHMIPFTHFLCLPIALGNDALVGSVREFLRDVKAKHVPSSRGLDESIFAEPKQLHLTVAMMRLLTPDAVRRAADVLRSKKVSAAVERAIASCKGTGGLGRITVRGLEIMNDDPSDVDVLFAKVEASEALSNLLSDIVSIFVDEGIIDHPDAPTRLHATVMNTRFRDRDDEAEYSGDKPTRVSFDARGIIADFGTRHFGDAVVSGVHISQRHAYSQSGFFRCAASLDFPTRSAIPATACSSVAAPSPAAASWRVISGGSSGADVGALLGAIDAGASTGGIARRGRMTPFLKTCGFDECSSDGDTARDIACADSILAVAGGAIVGFRRRLPGTGRGTDSTMNYALNGKYAVHQPDVDDGSPLITELLGGRIPGAVVWISDKVPVENLSGALVSFLAKHCPAHCFMACGLREQTSPGTESLVRSITSAALKSLQQQQP